MQEYGYVSYGHTLGHVNLHTLGHVSQVCMRLAIIGDMIAYSIINSGLLYNLF